MSNYKKKLVVPYEPYGDLIYVIKTYLEVKNMMEVTSGDYVKETDLTESDDINEKRFTDWNDHQRLEEDILKQINLEYSTCNEDSSNASQFNIYEKTKYMNETRKYIGRNSKEVIGFTCDGKETDLINDDIDEIDNIKETDLSDHGDNIKETDLIDDEDNIKETDLINDDVDEINIIKETDLIDDEDIIKETDLIDDEDDITETDLLDDDVDEIDTTKKTYIIDEIDNITETDLLYDEDIIKETDLTDDGDIMKDTDLTDLPDFNIDSLQYQYIPIRESSDDEENIQFQDIDTDFFETDCEYNDEIIDNCKTKMDNIENNDYGQTDAETKRKEYLQQNDIKKTSSNSDVLRNKQSKSPPMRKKNRHAVMSSALLRSTINELERALNNSNILLEKRDQRIRQLFANNIELKRKLTKLTNHNEVKLQPLKKEDQSSSSQIKVSQLQKELEKAQAELSDLRLLSNGSSYRGSSQYDPIHKTKDTIQVQNSNEENTFHNNKSHFSKNTCYQMNTSCKQNKSNDDYKSKRVSRKADTTERCSSSKHTSTDTHNRCCYNNQETENSDDKLSKTELHTNLRMRFMRDAFFYYMIGFHPDEQINAILAILDYGDQRQDFVLEAHKLKKTGKSFSVTNVSSRGLSFVQKEIKK